MYRIILLLLFTTSLSAQSAFDISPNPAVGTWGGTLNFFNADAFITNDSDSTVTFAWERIIEDIPITWESSICTNTTCLPPEVSSGEFEVDPGYSVDLDCSFYPNNTTGNGQVEVNIWIKGDTSEIITQVFLGSVNSTNTLEIAREKSFSIFPNPTGDVFSLKGNENYSKVEIYNAQGQLVKKFQPMPEYTLEFLPTNLYFVHVLSEQKEVLKVLKIKKQ